MTRNKLFLLLFALLPIGAFGQLENTQWHFGSGIHVDFNTNPFSVAQTASINTTEGCASIASSTGQVLFYTDGITVWDINDNPMPNGQGLNGNPSSTQSGVIVPDPASSDRYYVFTAGAPYAPPYFGINYSIVDMTLNGGLGDVTVINQQLLLSACEKITAVPHCNGQDYWVVVHEWDSDAYYTYPVTSAGVGAPVISNVGVVHTDGGINFYTESIGYLKVSPDARKLGMAIYSPGNIVEILDFDNATGVVSNALTDSLTFNPGNLAGPYGVSFSPDGNLFYAAFFDVPGIYQYDATATTQADFVNSKVQIATPTSTQPAALQIGPNDTIYISNFFDNFLGSIDNPNVPGVGCGYVEQNLSLGSGTAQGGLPNFPDAVVIQTNNTQTNATLCDGDSLVLDAGPNGTAGYLWSTGDTTQTLTTDSSGIYWVQVYTQGGCFYIDSFTVNAVAGPPLQVNLGSAIHVCGEDTVFLDAGAGPYTYLWSTGDTSQILTVLQTGEYWVEISDGNCSGRDTLDVEIEPFVPPPAELPNVFTPNGDGVNDNVDFSQHPAPGFDVVIYNRWGNEIFRSTDPAIPWEGKSSGRDLYAGTYYFVMHYTPECDETEVLRTGHITLIR